MALKAVFHTNLTDTWTNAEDGDPVGAIRWETASGEGSKAYKCVQYNDAAVAALVSEAVYYSGIDGYRDSLVSRDVSDSDGPIGAGILQAVIADQDFGWVQIKGFAIAAAGTITAGVDGDPLTPVGAGDGELDVNIATAANAHICAWAGDSANDEIMCDFPY